MVPKIIVTNAGLDVHGMAQYFEEIHREDSVDVVRFLRKFIAGTLISDLQLLKTRWNELPMLDSDRAAARARKDVKEFERLTAELNGIGVVLKDYKHPKTGELTTMWEVAR